MMIARVFLILFLNVFILRLATAASLPTPLVETGWLAENLNEVVLLDVRGNAISFTTEPVIRVDKKSGKKSIVRVGGHIPDANLLLYKNLRVSKNINGKKVNGLVPDKNKFTEIMQNAGVSKNSKIVIVTNAESNSDVNLAARIYWQVKYFGHDEVAILNGGTAQWLLEGREYSIKPKVVNNGDWEASDGRDDILATSDEVVQAINQDATQILDARPLGQYLGVNNKKSGHVPSAMIFPIELMTSTRAPVKFLNTQALQELIGALKTSVGKNTITYCNSGHMASGSWFVMHELLGNQQTQLYDGSMSQWNAEKRPIARMVFE